MSLIEQWDFMIHQLLNVITEILPLANSNIAHYATSLMVFAVPKSMIRFKSISLFQNRLQIKLFLQKNAKFSYFRALEAPPQSPQNTPPSLRISNHAPVYVKPASYKCF